MKIIPDKATCTRFPEARLTGKEDPTTGLPTYTLEGPLQVRFFVDGGWRCLSVPEGFEYDGASLPRIVRAVWDAADPEAFLAATVHDVLYSSQGGMRAVPGFKTSGLAGLALDRRQVDGLLYNLMRLNGAGYLRSKCYLYAVRLGGKAAWDDPN